MAVGKAVVASQGFTNLKVGPLALDLIQCGLTVDEVLQALRQHDRWMDYRQIAIVSATGEVGVHTGELNASWAGHLTGDGVVFLGNGLPDADVLVAMQSAFDDANGALLAEQLLIALEQGRSVLGLRGPLVSSSLMVRSPSETDQFDLRIDVATPALGQTAACSVADLRRLFETYRPLAKIYEMRSRTPHPV
jgi:uncharacterized Ntn-hydrolase superfamily protein